MTQDARFEDAGEGALALRAESPEDLQVIAALVQDAVLSAADIVWNARTRRLALLINRFRWEDKDRAEAARRPYERTRALLVIGDVTGVSSMGINRKDP